MYALVEILSNVRCRVTGLEKAIYKAIDAELSMPIAHAFHAGGGRRQRGHWDDGKKHFLYWPDEGDKATFPKGLLPRVEDTLTSLEVKYRVVDCRKRVLPEPDLSKVTPDMLDGISMTEEYSYQFDIVQRALIAQAGILWLATNAGKTEIAAAITKALSECVVLIVVPKKKLLYQTRERIAKRLGTIPSEIGIIGDGKFMPTEVTVAVVNSVTPKTVRKKGTALARRMYILRKYLKSVECVFFDEGHHTKARTWYKLTQALSNAQFRYVLSGTPFGSGSALTVEAACGPVIARIKNEELIELGVSAEPHVRMIEIDQPVMSNDENSIGAWHNVYQEGIVCNMYRNEVLAREAVKFARSKKRTLILIRDLQQGDMLKMLISPEVTVEFVHGKMPTEWVDDAIARFEEDEQSVLIASPIFDEGVDIPAMKALIIADGGKSVRATLQKIGRGVRRKTSGENVIEVVDCADLTHQWLSDHSLDRLEIYEGEGFKVSFEEPKTEGEEVDEEEKKDDSGEALQRILRKIAGGNAPAGVSAAPVRESTSKGERDISRCSDRMLWHRRASS